MKTADKLNIAFAHLIVNGLNRQKHQELFDGLANNADNADKLAKAFTAIISKGFNYTEHPVLFHGLMNFNNAYYSDKLAEAFIALISEGLNYTEHQVLFDGLIKNAGLKFYKEEGIIMSNFHADKLAEAFITLITAGFNYKEHPVLFNKLVENAMYADKLAGMFIASISAGLNYKEHPVLFNKLVENAMYANKLTDAFTTLIKKGLNYAQHPELFNFLIRKAQDASIITRALQPIVSLIKGRSLILYNYIVNNVLENCNNYAIFKTLEQAHNLGFTPAEHSDIYKCILSENDFALIFLEDFFALEFKAKPHDYIYQAYFCGPQPLINSPYSMTLVTTQIKNFLKNESLKPAHDEKYADQITAIQNIINQVIITSNNITQGPLNKSEASKILEHILKQLTQAETPLKTLKFQFDDRLGYILQIDTQPKVYLHELLKLVNFNHVELSEDEITSLWRIVNSTIPNSNGSSRLNENNIIIQRLPYAAKLALQFYTGNQYLNINRLFRGVKQNDESLYVWINPASSKENLTACFLTGCIVNWVAAILPHNLLSSEERCILNKVIYKDYRIQPDLFDKMKRDNASYTQVLEEAVKQAKITTEEFDKIKNLFAQLKNFFPQYDLIDRVENLKKAERNGELAINLRRRKNPTFLPSVGSFSTYKHGVAMFYKKDSVHTKVESDNTQRPIINKREQEIITPLGTSYLYCELPNGNYVAREVSSPAIQPYGDYWSSSALVVAYQSHLSQPYKDIEHKIELNGKITHRPNHGLAHTYRVMIFIDVIIEYFSCFAQDESFQTFCQEISGEQRAWLRVAAAFSISGRESEISASENLKRYDEFRESSKKHMEAFLKQHPPSLKNGAMQERMLHIVRWMGNPGYEKELSGNKPINSPDNEEEKAHRNYAHRLLTIAHKLDLPRCYGPKSFANSIAVIQELSTDSPEQKTAYQYMIRYAIELIQAHGDSLYMKITPSGDLISCREAYKTPFEMVSHNVRQLREMTDTVPHFKICDSNHSELIDNFRLSL